MSYNKRAYPSKKRKETELENVDIGISEFRHYGDLDGFRFTPDQLLDIATRMKEERIDILELYAGYNYDWCDVDCNYIRRETQEDADKRYADEMEAYNKEMERIKKVREEFFRSGKVELQIEKENKDV